ncbi:MAG TPA: TRIC cation channel family protein [Solirubrobacteraceae bacterium]|nr:TRIC cation channel family protein [Solirubrobacteraceae bacterium]
MDEPAQVPLWIDLAAVAFGGMQGGVFGTAGHDERNDFDLLGVAVFAVVMGLGGGVIRDVLLGQVPAALRDDTYLVVAVLAGFAGMLLAEVAGRFRWTFDALDAVVVGLFVVVGALKTQDAGLQGGAIIVLGATTGIGGGVLRDLLAQRPVLLVQRSTPYALVALLGAAAFVALDTAGARWEVAAGACLAVVFAVRMLALARGWRSPAPFAGARRRG